MQTRDRQIWLDGRFVPWGDATVHLLSHSLQRGSLVFDYLSVHETPRGPACFRLPEHLQRFRDSCELVGLPQTRSSQELTEAVVETVRRNEDVRAVKVCAYLASLELDVVPADDHVTVAIAAYDPLADTVQPAGGRKRVEAVRIWLEKQARQRRPDIVSPHAKVAANYVSPMTAKWKAKRAGYDEILLIDARGMVAEGPTTNVFCVDADGVLWTPPDEGVLLGVTRRSILEIAKHAGYTVREEAIAPEFLFDASEAFLTGTSAGVWPVESIDDRLVGDGRPGPVSQTLSQHFRRIVRGEDPAFEHWLTYVDAT